jgi:hypothetical protein
MRGAHRLQLDWTPARRWHGRDVSSGAATEGKDRHNVAIDELPSLGCSFASPESAPPPAAGDDAQRLRSVPPRPARAPCSLANAAQRRCAR